MKQLTAFLAVVFLFSCEPLVTDFRDIEDAVLYESSSKTNIQNSPDSLLVMTWNIRFGAARIPWFGDSCGDRVIMTNSEVITHLDNIADYINSVQPDILLLQEVDVESKRSGYVDQVQWFLDNTYLNYGAYASMWQAQFIPSDGLGRVDAGNAILSRWEITDAERIQLPLRTDQDGLTQYFYLRRNILKTKIAVPNQNGFYAVCAHTTAFATDNTKQKHIEKFYETINSIDTNAVFIAGGDLNALTPWATTRDFCEEDRCDEEVCDEDYENNEIYQGSYFNNLPDEVSLLRDLYRYSSAIDSLSTENTENFTHSTWNTNENNSGFIDSDYWDRKLDYIFSNVSFTNGTTHQEAYDLSDHAPVSAGLTLP
ncbi:MAG TPA: endonuclease/exonuclease/phosphatase family protein [Candidatus Marinimicrobia bacterium]|nr:endonuclease/exonuclease/phosphatase family protein [Candidatus Neomarinimicrobiota bacterium]